MSVRTLICIDTACSPYEKMPEEAIAFSRHPAIEHIDGTRGAFHRLDKGRKIKNVAPKLRGWGHREALGYVDKIREMMHPMLE